jgi:hypothetical protein
VEGILVNIFLNPRIFFVLILCKYLILQRHGAELNHNGDDDDDHDDDYEGCNSSIHDEFNYLY